MTARIIDGKAIAQKIREEIGRETAERLAQGKRPPGLAVVLVGENPASVAYVRNKGKAASEVGFHSIQVDLPSDTTEAEVLEAVARLNADASIDGILVQLPLPRGIDEPTVVGSVDPTKDVDGLHTVNAGLLASGREGFVPCTPLGIRELILREGIETRGRHAVVVGRSNLVGKPVVQLLLAKGPGGDATVTVAHSATKDLGAVTREADILIVAAGRPAMVDGSMVKPGACVIDVGINRVEDAAAARGYRLVGDVDFDSAARVASAITPVPGGVGPMTIAMLLRNTLDSAKRREP